MVSLQAIQSYRATMALLRQQEIFVDTLLSSGMVEAHEASAMMEPIDARLRTLSQQGAVWRSPPLTEVCNWSFAETSQLKGVPLQQPAGLQPTWETLIRL